MAMRTRAWQSLPSAGYRSSTQRRTALSRCGLLSRPAHRCRFTTRRRRAMFKRILIPLDLTDKHHAALSKAADLARHSDGRVTLLHVIEVIPGLAVEEEK